MASSLNIKWQKFILLIASSAFCAGGAVATTIDQVKISGLLLNTQNNGAALTTDIGTGTATILAYANTVNFASADKIGTAPTGAIATTLQNNTVTDGTNTIAAKTALPLTGGEGANPASYRVTFTLSGTGQPVFSEQAIAGNLALLGQVTSEACSVSSAPQAVDGGGVGQAFVTFQFSLSNGCSSADPVNLGPGFIALDVPWRLQALGEAVVTVTVLQDRVASGTYLVFDGAPGVRTLARPFAMTDVALSAKPALASGAGVGAVVPTRLARSGGGYTTLSTDAGTDLIIGSYKAQLTTLAPGYAGPSGAGQAPVIFSSLGRGGLTTLTAADINYDLTLYALSGDWQVIKPKAGGVSPIAVSVTQQKVLGVAVTSGWTNITVAMTPAENPMGIGLASPQTYAASLTPHLAVGSAPLAPGPLTLVPLETINLDGTYFNAPWFGGPAGPGQARPP